MAHLAQCLAMLEGLSVIGAQLLEADRHPKPGPVDQGVLLLNIWGLSSGPPHPQG